jgi:hypothetical protein
VIEAMHTAHRLPSGFMGYVELNVETIINNSDKARMMAMLRSVRVTILAVEKQ